MKPVVVFLPLRIVSVSNRREHWAPKAERTKEHRGLARLMLSPPLAELRALLARVEARVAVEVSMLRIAPPAGKRLDEPDNLGDAFKAVRDGITDALCPCRCLHCLRGKHALHGEHPCVDDRDERLTWRCAQTTGTRWQARIEIVASVGSTGIKANDRAGRGPRQEKTDG